MAKRSFALFVVSVLLTGLGPAYSAADGSGGYSELGRVVQTELGTEMNQSSYEHLLYVLKNGPSDHGYSWRQGNKSFYATVTPWGGSKQPCRTFQITMEDRPYAASGIACRRTDEDDWVVRDLFHGERADDAASKRPDDQAGLQAIANSISDAGASLPNIDAGYVQQDYGYEESPDGQKVTIDGTLRGPSIQVQKPLDDGSYWWSVQGEYLQGGADYDGYLITPMGNIPAELQTDDTYERARVHFGQHQSSSVLIYTGLEYEQWEFTFTNSKQRSIRTYYHLPLGLIFHSDSTDYAWRFGASAQYIPTGSSDNPAFGRLTEAANFDQEGHGWQIGGEYLIKNRRLFDYGLKLGYHYRTIDRSDNTEVGLDNDDDGQPDETATAFEPAHERSYTEAQLFVRF